MASNLAATIVIKATVAAAFGGRPRLATTVAIRYQDRARFRGTAGLIGITIVAARAGGALAGTGSTIFNDPPLLLIVDPPDPPIPAETPVGTVVATLTGRRSSGRPFAGNFTLGPPNWDQGAVWDQTNLSWDLGTGAIYAIVQPGGFGTVANLILNPMGPGVGASGGALADLTIFVNDPPALPTIAGLVGTGELAASTGVRSHATARFGGVARLHGRARPGNQVLGRFSGGGRLRLTFTRVR